MARGKLEREWRLNMIEIKEYYSEENEQRCISCIEKVIEIVEGEAGLVTKEITEREFEEKASKLPEMITRIRMEK